MMSGQWIYSSGDDLGFLNGTAFLLFLLALLFSTGAVVFGGFISDSCRDVSPLATQIDLKCKVSTLFPMPSLDYRQGVSGPHLQLN